MQKAKILPAIKVSRDDFDILEKRIKELFKKEIFYPILAVLKEPKNTLKNSVSSRRDLIDAITFGNISYRQGKFTGKFTAPVSKELKELGAKWSKKDSAFLITRAELPMDVKNAISASFRYFEEKMEKIDKILREVVPEELAEKLKAQDLFEKTLWKVNKDFVKNVESIGIKPRLTVPEKEKIAEEWQNNLQLYIKDFTEEFIPKFRKQIEKNVVEKGLRREDFVGSIQAQVAAQTGKSYEECAAKAKFLARQETSLLMAKYQEVRYQGYGIDEYYWQAVTGTPLHPTRPRHKELSDMSKKGKTFRFSDPPITTAPGEPVRRNNPGQDYNCFPGSTFITLDRPINKLFRRRFTGELTQLICDDGIILDSTGNHPILTGRGWIAAKDIQVGDNLIYSEIDSFFGKEVYRKNVVTTFENIFSALGFCFDIRVDTLSETDFHNDVFIDKEVDVITIDRKLMLNRIASIYEQLHHFLFKSSNPTIISDSAFFHKFITEWNPSHSLISFFGELTAFIKIHFTHSDYVSLASRPFWNSEFFQPPSDDTPPNIEFNGDCKFTHSILVILDSFLINSGDFVPRPLRPTFVIRKSIRNFSGHVYNLQSINGEYLAQNRVVHNCRCSARPVIRKE